jgi:hypothetical protein
MHKNMTLTLLTICTLLVSNWGLASIDGGSPTAGAGPGHTLSMTLSSQARDQAPAAGVLWLAQVGDLLRDTIRRQIRQRLETGEFDDNDLDDDDDRVGDNVSNVNGNENDNSSPDDDSQDNDDPGLDNSDDASEDSDDEPSNDDGDDSDNGDRGNSGVNRGRGPRGSFDSQF